jgi:hypothetical protein
MRLKTHPIFLEGGLFFCTLGYEPYRKLKQNVSFFRRFKNLNRKKQGRRCTDVSVFQAKSSN